MADDEDAVIVKWQIADGYYLYRNKFKFFGDTQGIELKQPEFPPAETRHDEFFGDVAIYRGEVSIRVPIERDLDASDILTLNATSQGCADLGICYPPHSQTLLLKLAEAQNQSPTRPVDRASPPPFAEAATKPARPLTALADLGQDLGISSAGDEILEPEQAFQFSAEVTSPEALGLYWRVAEGTYLYRDKVEISLEAEDGTNLGSYSLPSGKVKHDTIRPDGTIGDIEVFVGDIELGVPLLRQTPESTEASLTVKFQGCAEIGICYPPIKREIALTLPPYSGPIAERAVTRTASAAPVPEPSMKAAELPMAEQDRIAATLAGGSIWLTTLSFFGFGLLLAFTPCVFPMIPILSGILAGQGARITPRKGFLLSSVYVLAMALTYTVAGVLAGLFGGNLQAAFQNPWILVSFAAVFVLLAFSMFGFYNLQLPSSLQGKLAELSNRQEGGTFAGVAIMGFLSALIVGPCVAPPLAGALIYIGQTGDAFLGGLALFALSLGMGAPLILIGTSAGKFLPRAGAWMDTVKAVFGVLLLAVAIILLERVVAPEIAMVLWGALMIISAVYMGALKALPVEVSGWSQLWKGLGVVILIYGALMLLGAAAGGKDTLQPLRGIALPGGAGAAAHVEFKRIKTTADLDRELAAAKAANRPVMLDFYADWCVSCKEMERYTFSDPNVLSALSGFVTLQADVTENDEDDQALLQQRFGLPGPPAIMFFDRGGEELRHLRVVGFMAAEDFAGQLAQAAR